MTTQQEKPADIQADLTAIPSARTEEPAKVLPGFGATDAEVAKYLDPTVVIDEETNRRIKKLVRSSL